MSESAEYLSGIGEGRRTSKRLRSLGSFGTNADLGVWFCVDPGVYSCEDEGTTKALAVHFEAGLAFGALHCVDPSIVV